MSGDRYTVGTVGGWPITANTMSGRRLPSREPGPIAYVYDSANCYRTIAVFDPFARYGPRNKLTPTEAAHALAEKLNVEEREWEASL